MVVKKNINLTRSADNLLNSALHHLKVKLQVHRLRKIILLYIVVKIGKGQCVNLAGGVLCMRRAFANAAAAA